MKTMQSKLKKIKEALLTVTDRVGHYEIMEQTDQYIVWAEDSEAGSVEGDNRKQNQAIQGTIDFFTKTDLDEMVDRIQEALKAACISFYLNSVQHEEETGYIHYEWVWSIA